MTHTDDSKTWRYSEDGETISRGHLYRLPYDWTTDAWQHYWDGDQTVAFIDGGHRHGTYAIDGTDEEQTERAITAYRYGSDDSLNRLAPRLTGQPDSVFIHVTLAYNMDLYALSWSGEGIDEWRDEIEAVWNGDIWRIEVEEYAPGMGPGGSDWVPTDEVPEEFYGEDKAQAGYVHEFPLAEFPADLLVTSDQ